MTRSRMVALALLACLSVNASAAAACFCSVGDPSALESLNLSDAVFLGAVETFERIGIDEEILAVTFRVQRSWKGVSVNTVVVYTPARRADCGFTDFMKGGEFLVYATNRPGDRLTTDLCARTRTRADADDDIVELGPASVVGVESSSFGRVKGLFEH